MALDVTPTPSPTASSSEALALEAELRARAIALGSFVGSMWLSELVDAVVFGGRLDALGIRPRSIEGLYGIALAPFLHGGFRHLFANTFPLLVLGFIVMSRRKRHIVAVSTLSVLVAGFGTWLIGASGSSHIGASSIVFGYLGFLISRGWFERSWSALGWAAFTFVFYGGALWGVLPGTPGVSWEGHLFGFVGGVLAARWLTNRAKRRASSGTKST
jgi:membrane associated rhomboid family serine protease